MQGIIHLESIVKSYYLGKQELQVLKGLNMDILKNEYVALIPLLEENISLMEKT